MPFVKFYSILDAIGVRHSQRRNRMIRVDESWR